MICGIVAEFNPLHNGHIHLLRTVRQTGEVIVVCMSGNFVQRGEPAIFDKWKRAEAAVKCGADLVVELPSAWAVASANKFAKASVGMLADLGVDTLAFGCENDDIDMLKATSDYSSTEEYKQSIKEELNTGTNYASAACKANKLYSDVMSGANNLLAVEYIGAAKELIPDCRYIPIKRLGVEHDSQVTDSDIASASAIRALIRTNGDITPFVPPQTSDMLTDSLSYPSISALDSALLGHIKMLPPESISSIPDVTEGLENRIAAFASTASTVDELLFSVKSKRFTLARMRRIVLNSLLLSDGYSPKEKVPYIRPLAFGERGRAVISDAAGHGISVYTKSSRFAEDADPEVKQAFAHECRADSFFYSLIPDEKIQSELTRTPYFHKG